MAYDIKNAKETKLEPLLEPDTIVDGVIVEIKDGKVKDFVTEERLKKWDSDPESECIELSVEVKCERAENGFIKIHKLLTYKTVNNITTYSDDSNMAKYKNKYGKLPEVGDQVKVEVDGSGFGNVKLK